eukprot:gene17453-24143_t
MLSELYPINSRVRDLDGFRGTVRYIGPVAVAKNKIEDWLGIEWDNATRGKHDGSCVDENGNLFKYFECLNGSGSFVKPNKLENSRSFVEGLNERYVGIDAPSVVAQDSAIPDAFVTTAKGKAINIEFVGESQIRKWQQISKVNKVSLRNDNISKIGMNVGEVASHLIEIDLQDNLLWQWEEITLLAVQVPNLSSLLLHGNKMEALVPDSLPKLASFPNLRVLALHSCNIKSWSSIQLLEPFLPVIEELCLANNLFPDLPRVDAELEYQAATGLNSEPMIQGNHATVQGFLSLRHLDLSFCGLDDWSQVQAFGKLPSLRELILDSNPFTKIRPAEDESFASLQRFSLSSI